MAILSYTTVREGLRAARAIREGKLPTPDEIAAAPRLSSWAVVDAETCFPRLVGEVHNHPHLADGWCTTSVVLAMDPDGQWARKISRLYRLSDPLAL